MREYAREVMRMIAGADLARYQADPQLRLAVERAMEIIGESARRVSPAFQEAHPEIPWQRIISQRNFIAHEYEKINAARIWETATLRVPELIRVLDPLITMPPSGA
jgi:uncharacterized protein with HEPN domain